MSNIVDRVEDRIQNAILTAIENNVAPIIEPAIRSIKASSGRDATSVFANSERRERVRVNASLQNASRNNDTLDVSNVNDETRHNIPDEVSELSVPVTHFDRQSHTHHNTGLLTVVEILRTKERKLIGVRNNLKISTSTYLLSQSANMASASEDSEKNPGS